METKQKVIIAILSIVLIFVIAICWYSKPKPYKKKIAESKKTKETETNAQPIVVNNLVNPDCYKKEEETDKVIEKITATECAERLYNAMLGHGTDNRAVLQCFDYIDTDEEFDEVMEEFERLYEESFDVVLGREMFSGKILANKINDMLAERNIERIITIE